MGSIADEEFKKFISTVCVLSDSMNKKFEKKQKEGYSGWDNILNAKHMFDAARERFYALHKLGDAWSAEEVEEELVNIAIYIAFLWNLSRGR